MALWRVMTFEIGQDYDAAMSPPPSTIAPGTRAGTCRWCRGRLSALARVRGDVCDAMDCRRREADERAKARLHADLDALRAAAAPAVAAAPVLWLRHHGHDFAPPAMADIAALRAHLEALEGDVRATPPPAGDASSSALDAPLCALCRGRCCRFGLDGRAFLEAHHLRAWLAQHPGARWADAVEHYLGLVAPEHLAESCLFHARTGCTLPRAQRSDVCNQFACDTLEQARDIAGAAADALVVVGVAASQELHGAAVVTAEGARLLDVMAGRDG